MIDLTLENHLWREVMTGKSFLGKLETGNVSGAALVLFEERRVVVDLTLEDVHGPRREFFQGHLRHPVRRRLR
jgi:hypothetical protein